MRTLTSTELTQTNGGGNLTLELTFDSFKNTFLEPGLAGAAACIVFKFLTDKSFSGTTTLVSAATAIVGYNVYRVADIFTLN